MKMKVTRYSFCFTLIFTISLVMIISGSTDALGNHIDCTLKSPPIWDKTIESGESSQITWDNPSGNTNSSHCRYDVLFYHADKSNAGLWSDSAIASGTINWDSIGTKYFKICPTNDNDCKSNSEFYSFVLIPNLSKQNTSIDCTLKSPPIWDKTIEVNESILITWDSPDIHQCRYDVIITDNGYSEIFKEEISSLELSQKFASENYFKICPTNDSACSSEFGPINVLNTEMNNFFIILGIGVTLAGILILFMIKKKGSKKLPIPSSTPASSTAVPASTEKPQEENITDIDKQIAINEEKIRKMDEESKKLDDEDESN